MQIKMRIKDTSENANKIEN